MYIPYELERFLSSERDKQIVILQHRLQLSKEDAQDVFQDASIALFENIEEGRLVALHSTLSTYFTSICLHLGLKRLRQLSVQSHHSESVEQYMMDEYDMGRIHSLVNMEDEEDVYDEIRYIRTVVDRLPKPCGDILWRYYGDNLHLSEIATLLGYKNANTVKAKKSDCISRLRVRMKGRIGSF